MTAVMIQSNKIVLNEVENNSALLEPAYRKKKNPTDFMANPIVSLLLTQFRNHFPLYIIFSQI